MQTYFLGRTQYISHAATSGDAEVTVNPVTANSYRIYNTGTEGVNLIVKDSSDSTTIAEVADDKMLDIVYDTDWRLSSVSTDAGIPGDLTVGGTINTATITGGTWTEEKSNWLDQDVKTTASPEFNQLFIQDKFSLLYDSTNNAIVFAASDGTDTRRVMMLNASMNIYNGGAPEDPILYLDRTIDGGGPGDILTPARTLDGGGPGDLSETWTYKFF